MKKLLLTFLVMLISSSVFSQTGTKIHQMYPIALMDGDIRIITPYAGPTTYSQLPAFHPDMLRGGGSIVPFTAFYTDYQTNGNSLQMIIASGDTVIVAANYVDSLDAPNANAGTTARISYNISYDNGATWVSTDGFVMSDNKSRWPDMYLANIAGSRTVVTGGRFFDPGNSAVRHAGVSYDALLGVGSPQVFTLGETSTGNSDMFIHMRPDGNVATVYSPNSTDSIVYRTFDPTTNTFGPRVHVNAPNPTLSNTVSAYTIGSSMSGNHMTIAYNYVNEPTSGGDPLRSIRVQTSVDNGATWSAPTKILGNGIINGDSLQPYWHIDIGYKPATTNPYVVFSTFDYTSTANVDTTRATWKIIMQSPSVNGGNPVVVADYHDPNIPILNDINQYTALSNRIGNASATYTPYQVNAAYLSHPSVGFSNDGSVIYVAYSVIQSDTSTVGISDRYYNFFDVYLSASTDGGLTWATKNVTNTPNIDEMYPVVAEVGNTNTKAHLTYHSTTMPGSQNFGPTGQNPQSPVARVFQIHNFEDKPVGINNISSEVPTSHSLKQNYPNPFNPSTSIRFDIAKTSRVTLKVYDVNGKEVATLVNNEQVTPGLKEVTFDASRLSTGVYFYTLIAADFVETKKMMLIK